MSADKLIAIASAYASLRPVDLSEVIAARKELTVATVEAAFLTDPRCYRAARGDRTLSEVAAVAGLSATVVGRFERCCLREIAKDKIALLAALYARFADEESSLAHIGGEETTHDNDGT